MKMSELCISMAVALWLTGCASDYAEDGESGIPGGQTEVTLRLQDVAGEAVSRTQTGTDGERSIAKIEVWAFHSAGETAAGVLAKYHAETTTGSSVSFVMDGGKYDFYVVANQQIGTQPTRSALLSQTTSLELNSSSVSGFLATSGLPMTGAVTGRTILGTLTTNTISLSVRSRAARIDSPTAASGVKVELADATGLDAVMPLPMTYNAETPNLDFRLTGFTVANGISKSWLFNPTIRAAAWTLPAGAVREFSTFDAGHSYTGVYSGMVSYPSEFFLDPTALDPDDRPAVYVYENYPATKTVGEATGYDRREVYAMIIRGAISETGNPANTATRYWRINLVRGSSGSPNNFKIEENKIYKVDVTSVLSLGYANPEDAEKEPGALPVVPVSGQTSVRINLSIDEWEVSEEPSVLS